MKNLIQLQKRIITLQKQYNFSFNIYNDRSIIYIFEFTDFIKVKFKTDFHFIGIFNISNSYNNKNTWFFIAYNYENKKIIIHLPHFNITIDIIYNKKNIKLFNELKNKIKNLIEEYIINTTTQCNICLKWYEITNIYQAIKKNNKKITYICENCIKRKNIKKTYKILNKI